MLAFVPGRAARGAPHPPDVIPMTFCSLPVERMSERATDDVRAEQRGGGGGRAAAARQQQGGGGDRSSGAATAMATRAALPSPEAMLGQPWNHWLQHAKLPLYAQHVTELEESFKEHGKSREAMRLSREDMPIFGLCPAYDDFYLVMCNHCNQVIKPQAFQSHYERRHGSLSKPPLTLPSSTVYSLLSALPSKSKGSIGSGNKRPSSGSSASSVSKMLKSPKDKLQMSGNKPMHPLQHSKLIHEKSMTPSVKVEKMHLNPKIDGVLLKPAAGSTCSVTVSSSKTGLNCPSIPKPPLPSPGHIPNGKGLLSSPPFSEKKPEDTNNRKFLHKRLSEREFDPDIHCGVVDVETKKPCTRSLTCKTHSLGYRRAVQGRRKRFDVLLAEHKSNTRERELLRNSEHPQQLPALREPHPSPSKTSQELHQNSHGAISYESKHPLPCKSKPINPSLPRPTGNPVLHSINAPSDAPSVHESPHPVVPAVEPTSRLSSDDGEGDEKEEFSEKLDCHYSGHHPRPAAVCSFGSRRIGRGCFVYDKRWDHIRCALNFMVDKHLNSQMWKKIPPASNSMSTHAPHRTSTSSMAVLQNNVRAAGFVSSTTVAASMLVTPTCTSVESKVLSYGTSVNTHPTSSTMGPVCSMQSRQVSSSPSMPSVLSSVPSPVSSKPQKLKSNKSLKPKESLTSGINCTSSSCGSGKKRKNSSPLLAQSSHSVESFRKNCVVNSGTSNHSSVVSQSHCSANSVGVNCLTNKSNAVGLRHDVSVRCPPTGSPAESIKRMSVVMNSSDSTLSLGPFVHQSSEQTVNSHTGLSHTSLDKLIGKKHKCSPGSSSINSSSKSNKVAKLPSVNNVHSKHATAIPGTQGLTNSSLLHQPKARP
ncbi:ataxin-7 [Ambystoma mexicanum]|uniref:ataxin-7 n=1 Tax=Ambystoma mexicanum TaxID=8296 RepID=UPI0037E77FBC